MTSPHLELDDIQGNILQGYGMPSAAFVNLHIDDAEAGRAFLAALRPCITTARRWSTKPICALNVALAYRGLERLEVPDRTLATFPPEFAEGMEKRAGRLADIGDSAPAHWDCELRCLQMLLIVHTRRREKLQPRLDQLQKLVAKHAGVTWVGFESAEVPRFKTLGDSIREHFGYSDGFGQPAVAGQTGPEFAGQGVPTSRREGWRRRKRDGWRMLAPGEFILGYRDEDGVLPAAPEDPYGRNGTFMVFRKLKQDVEAFQDLLSHVADRHFGGDEELAAAKITGRWKDGTPVMLSADRKRPDLAENKWWTNDFRYADDPHGHVCPIGSHVRRANPRDALPGGGNRTRRHRIIRRGMPYGPEYAPATKDEPRGLLFVCFNASIARQFEVVNSWLTDGSSLGLDEGDLLTDGTGAPAMVVPGDPPALLQGPPEQRPLVRTCGGEYLFVPGIRALKELAK